MSTAYGKKKILAIVGPTASGKTDLAISLAKKFRGEIISADSRQIYRGMNIGTAKPPISPAPRSGAPAKLSAPAKAGAQNSVFPQSIGVMGPSAPAKAGNYPLVFSNGIPHYLIDIRYPDESYTAGQYKKDALAAIERILAKGRLPILVGGTGLYVSAVTENFEIPKVKPDLKLRKNLEKEIAASGLDRVFRKLVKLDPEAAYIVDPKNPRRVIRALEIALSTGRPFSAQRKSGPPLYDLLEIGISQPPAVLAKRIARRTAAMFKAGLVSEVEYLLKKYGARAKAFDAIGYREVIDYLGGKSTLSQCREAMTANTRHYAKRQMTWFKKDKKIRWVKDRRQAETLIKKFLSAAGSEKN